MTDLRTDCRQEVMAMYGKFLADGYNNDEIGKELRAALLWADSGDMSILDVDAAVDRAVSRSLRQVTRKLLATLPTEMESARPFLESMAAFPGQNDED